MRIYIKLLISLMLSVSCSNPEDVMSNKNREITYYDFRLDTANILADVEGNLDINEKIVNDKVQLSIISISKNEFLEAIGKSINSVRYFNGTLKINENTAVEGANRIGSTLNLGVKEECLKLKDIKGSDSQRARSYFLEEKIGLYYIFKKSQFEDLETVFWNSKTMNEDLILSGISLCARDSLIFYSDVFIVSPDDKFVMRLMMIDEDSRIDTLVSQQVNWTTNFSFFDIQEFTIYYIHRFYDQYELRSTYAKMKFKLM